MNLVPAAVERRRKLAKQIKNGVVFLASAQAAIRSRDTNHPYRQESYFYYLSACNEENTALIIDIADGKIRDEYFFCRPANAHTKLWDGKRLSPQQAKQHLQFNRAADINELKNALVKIACQAKPLYCLPGANAITDESIADLARHRRMGSRGGVAGPTAFIDAALFLDEMRVIKTTEEIQYLHDACALTATGIKAAMQTAMRAKNECEVEAAIINAYRTAGGCHAFLPIVAGGTNACTLHYTANNAKLKKGKLLLVDSGAELNGYAGDVSRTIPVNGEWSDSTLAVYNIVLAAQKAAIRATRPGTTWRNIENAAIRRLAAGLYSLGLCRGNISNIINNHRYRRFYPHGIGHFIGLDVHDVGNMCDVNGKPCRLRPGMALTIEPGLYLPDEKDIPQSLRGIGVRIEDVILVTKTGNVVLTDGIPKKPKDISQWMRT